MQYSFYTLVQPIEMEIHKFDQKPGLMLLYKMVSMPFRYMMEIQALNMYMCYIHPSKFDQEYMFHSSELLYK